jgi:hypothetical protein
MKSPEVLLFSSKRKVYELSQVNDTLNSMSIKVATSNEYKYMMRGLYRHATFATSNSRMFPARAIDGITNSRKLV